MGRHHLRVLTACMVVAVGAPAGAAEVTQVLTAAEPNKPFSLDFSVRWDRTQKRVRITREAANPPTADSPNGSIEEQTALRYTRVTNAIVPRLAIGVYQDLELHAELPYVLNDDTTWGAGTSHGFASTVVQDNVLNPDGGYCDPTNHTPCPIFPVPNTVYHGGRASDLKLGFAWAVFNDRKDDTKPTWVVGLDVTAPTAQLYEPVAGRDLGATGQPWLSPYSVAANPGPVGEKIWRFDVYTALSKRMGPFDPYVKAHVVGMQRTPSTFSNCDHAAAMAARVPAEAASWAAAACAADPSQGNASLPYVAGLVAGAELVPYQDVAQGQKVSIDIRLTADYTSRARWYNELTEATGKLLQTESYLSVGALFGLYLRASDNVALDATASLATDTSHFLTGEVPGTASYDARLDAPGSRFRSTEASIFTVSVAGIVRF